MTLVITNIEDLRRLAKERVPRMFYDYADSGSWTESTYRANESDFQSLRLRQRVAIDIAHRSTRREHATSAVWWLRRRSGRVAGRQERLNLALGDLAACRSSSASASRD